MSGERLVGEMCGLLADGPRTVAVPDNSPMRGEPLPFRRV